jgi:hypothetical protein
VGGILPAIPAVAVVTLGVVLDNDILLWAGCPVGVLTGVFFTWWLGRVAIRLRVGGPEMLYLMRTGRASKAVKVEVRPSRAWTAILGWTFGSIALFPQGIVPMIVLGLGIELKLWFLALYLPDPPCSGPPPPRWCCSARTSTTSPSS